MSIYIPEAKSIYFAKTKENFQEVISSYSIKNYRSAIVMLYSVVICDLLYKLQEMRDVYDDSVAKNILNEVETIRKNPKGLKKSKSFWEKELIDKIYKQTHLLDDVTYVQLNHLFEYRNFSAHPAINQDYDLVSQNQETVIACIKNVLQGVLIKPPILISNMVETIANDLSERKEIFVDNNSLSVYLNNKYLSKMDNKSKLRLFRDFWKFCFVITNDEDCKNNRRIIRRALEVITEMIEPLLPTFIIENEEKFSVSHDDECLIQLLIYLSSSPSVYNSMNRTVKLEVDSFLENYPNYRLIAWFLSNSLAEHIASIPRMDNLNLNAQTIYQIRDRLYSYSKLNGEKQSLIDAFVSFYGNSDSYASTKNRFSKFIEPYLSDFTEIHLLKFIQVSNDNNQIYNYYNIRGCNNKVIECCKELLKPSFDFSIYKNFYFDETLNKDDQTASNNEQNENSDDELPF